MACQGDHSEGRVVIIQAGRTWSWDIPRLLRPPHEVMGVSVVIQSGHLATVLGHPQAPRPPTPVAREDSNLLPDRAPLRSGVAHRDNSGYPMGVLPCPGPCSQSNLRKPVPQNSCLE